MIPTNFHFIQHLWSIHILRIENTHIIPQKLPTLNINAKSTTYISLEIIKHVYAP